VKLVILPGQRLKHDGEWRHEGDTVEVADDYQVQVLIHSQVAAPASEAKRKSS
jgi:ribosomal protein L9